jgi:hypothetical protein
MLNTTSGPINYRPVARQEKHGKTGVVEKSRSLLGGQKTKREQEKKELETHTVPRMHSFLLPSTRSNLLDSTIF